MFPLSHGGTTGWTRNQMNDNLQSSAATIGKFTDGTRLDLCDRTYIQKALEGDFNISEVITSRVTGEKVKMIGYPIRSEGKGGV